MLMLVCRPHLGVAGGRPMWVGDKEMTREKAFKRAVRTRMARTGEPYTSARLRLLTKQGQRRIAVTNGDSVAGTLAQAGLADVVIVWRDDLHEGPVLALPPARLRKVRADYLTGRHGPAAESVEKQLADRDAALRRHMRNPLTLWFEADLYDQLQLIQVLSRLRDVSPNPRLQIISIGEHPERARFGGLGELTGPQREGLVPMARSGPR